MEKLSAPQQAVYDFMVKYQEEKGYPPSVRDICKGVGLRSTSTVHGHLTRLEKKGLLIRNPSKPRAIEISELKKRRSGQVTLPVVGRVTAGTPILAQQDIQSYVSLPTEFVRSDNAFILSVRGDSMINAGIFDGDQIIVLPDSAIENGDIVVAMIPEDSSSESSATCKRFYREKDCIRLQPENPALSPIFVREATILGKVVGLLRLF